MKTIFFVALTLIVASLSRPVMASQEVSPEQVKFGTLPQDETWQGEIYLVGDVNIPEGVVVTIKAGTQINFANYDIFHGGEDPDRVEIVVHGKLVSESTPEQPVQLNALPEPVWKTISVDKNTAVINFQPYQVETESMRKEFHSFKQQYVILWSVIYAMWVLALL